MIDTWNVYNILMDRVQILFELTFTLERTYIQFIEK